MDMRAMRRTKLVANCMEEAEVSIIPTGDAAYSKTCREDGDQTVAFLIQDFPKTVIVRQESFLLSAEV